MHVQAARNVHVCLIDCVCAGQLPSTCFAVCLTDCAEHVQAAQDEQGSATKPEAISPDALPTAAQKGTTAAAPVLSNTEALNPSQVWTILWQAQNGLQ